MKKILIGFLFLAVLFSAVSAFALIVTDNVDRDKFQYETKYVFATKDVGANISAVALPVGSSTSDASASNQVTRYVLTRSNSTNDFALQGRLLGIGVSSNATCTAGIATFDVTVNGTISGIQAVITPAPIGAVGTIGMSGPQYSWVRQDRSDDRTAQGFKGGISYSYNLSYPYGRATPLTAGDTIGVKLTTSSAFAPITSDYVISVYVLE